MKEQEMKKKAMTSTQRQAKRREEMSEKGYKTLSLGFVHERYHEAFKQMAKQAESGNVSDDLKIEKVEDLGRVDLLEKRISELESESKALRVALSSQSNKTSKQAENVGILKVRLSKFKCILWRFYWRK